MNDSSAARSEIKHGRMLTGSFFSAAALDFLRSFYVAWGHQAVLAGGAVWFDGGSFSLMSSPTVLLPDVAESSVRALLRHTGKLAAVYGTKDAEAIRVPLFTLRDKNYDLANLQRQFRQQVRAAASRMEARECTWDEWSAAASRCDRETLVRRGKVVAANHPLLTPRGRERIVEAATAIPELRVHACFLNDEIVAYLVHLTLGETCEGLLAHRCETAHDSFDRFASHLLYFSFAKVALARPEVRAVCVGRQSVPANATLARFKCHAGFQPEPYHLRIRLHPLLAPVLENRIAAMLMRSIRIGLAKRLPDLTNVEVLERAGHRTGALTTLPP